MDNKPQTVENMANYFALPLLSLNKTSFGVGNFISSFVSDKGEIVVQVSDMNKVPQAVLAHPNYVFDIELGDEDGTSILVFTEPELFAGTLNKFKEGKYSEFTAAAKNQLKGYSGLPYKAVKIGSKEPFTADLLLALDKDPGLRARREADLTGDGGRVRIPEDVELLSKPSESNFITI